MLYYHIGYDRLSHIAPTPVNDGWETCFKAFFSYHVIDFYINKSYEHEDHGMVVDIVIDGMKLVDIINERVRELYLQYHNKQSNANMLEVKCDTEDYMLRTSEVQSTYPRFLFDHLAELLDAKRKGDNTVRDFKLYSFGQGCSCCPCILFIAQINEKFVWWKGPFAMLLNFEEVTPDDGERAMPHFHFYFEKSQYIRALQKLSKRYHAVYSEVPYAMKEFKNQLRVSAKNSAETHEMRAIDTLQASFPSKPNTTARHLTKKEIRRT